MTENVLQCDMHILYHWLQNTTQMWQLHLSWSVCVLHQQCPTREHRHFHWSHHQQKAEVVPQGNEGINLYFGETYDDVIKMSREEHIWYLSILAWSTQHLSSLESDIKPFEKVQKQAVRWMRARWDPNLISVVKIVLVLGVSRIGSYAFFTCVQPFLYR